MKIKLTKISTREAASFPGSIDIVFYKDEMGRLYRLRYVDNNMPRDVIEALHRVMCVSKYAPEIIDGEITMDGTGDVGVKMWGNIYVLQKNAENFKFIDITDKYEMKQLNDVTG